MSACNYTRYVLGSRWELGEKAIATHAHSSYVYADAFNLEFIGGGFRAKAVH